MGIWTDKTVLITGGTGSLGKAIVSFLLKSADPTSVRVFSRDELKQSELSSAVADKRLRFFIGDVRDMDRLKVAMRGVDIVIHTAAMKQIVTCEYNPFEAVRTNVLGANIVAQSAIEMGVDRVMAISTDKAVNPVNFYGATKLCMEKLIVQANSYVGNRETKLSCVRYGNVMGSRGSVLPVFQRQKESGTLTVTDERMSRFWITIDQAVMFVLSSVELMRGGEVFVPKLASSRILDLAFEVAPGCEIDITGVRPGEKIHEVLITQEEARRTVDIGDRYVIEPEFEWWSHRRHDGKRMAEDFRYSSEFCAGSTAERSSSAARADRPRASWYSAAPSTDCEPFGA